ncbi:hypothetical protein JTE90_013477 [Oedothorax gibbosus]|uniref:Uncharacterized protein n=1 Tax=Oedothorax gibbosus TaxID=931172 RepID=A0AAV6VLJ0_9ARAC|nr:hypothetical protein JTE90_013477 [Oedothorax gibbosus]
MFRGRIHPMISHDIIFSANSFTWSCVIRDFIRMWQPILGGDWSTVSVYYNPTVTSRSSRSTSVTNPTSSPSHFFSRCCCWGFYGHEDEPAYEPKVDDSAAVPDEEETRQPPKTDDWKAKVNHTFVVQKRFSQMKEEVPELDWDRLFIIWAKATLTED